MREADIVVLNGVWVGFWLPVEQAYSQLKKPKSIFFLRRDTR